MKDDLEKDLLHELFDYDNGQLIWKINRRGNKVKGNVAGYKTPYGYVAIRINKKLYLAHRLIYIYFKGSTNGKYIDHINRNPNDNRIENLRLVTQQENSFNSNAKGYTWDKKSEKWKTQISVNRKNVYVETFDTELEAREAYLKAKEIYHPIEN